VILEFKWIFWKEILLSRLYPQNITHFQS